MKENDAKMKMDKSQTFDCDVVILGSGMAGSTLAAILAKQGISTVIIDSGVHPRFALGESTVRETTKMLKILSDRYEVPEFMHLSNYDECRRHVSSNCGMKRQIGFVYHKEGKEQDPEEIYQAVIVEAFEPPEIHYHRQDTDSYLINVCLHYGAKVFQGVKVKMVDLNKDGVTVHTECNKKINAKYIADGSGVNSVLANQLQLRAGAPNLKTESRSIFNHFVDYKPLETVSSAKYPVPRPWHQGTTHQCFDGGWIWTIPFNNGMNPTNQMISVGLQLDLKKFPAQKMMSPEEEFFSHINRFPSLKKMFGEAKAVRPWVSTGRLTYATNDLVGDRYCLFGMAAGFVDPLYSRGLAITFTSIHPLAESLIKSVKTNVFRKEDFSVVAEYQSNIVKQVDSLVNGAYISYRDPDLFQAWVRVWLSAVTMGYYHLENAHKSFTKSGRNPEVLTKMLLKPNAESMVGSFCPSVNSFQLVFESYIKLIESVGDGKMESKTAAKKIFQMVEESRVFPPWYKAGDPKAKHNIEETLDELLEYSRWGNAEAPEELRKAFFAGDPVDNVVMFSKAARMVTEKKSKDELAQYLVQADMDWKKKKAA